MNAENSKKLTEKFEFLRTSGDLRKDLMVFGFECGDGWFDIIWSLCTEIAVLLETVQKDPEWYGPFKVTQVKEKYGGLRFYTTWTTEEIEALINTAESASYKTCEVCGKPGEPNDGGWIRTLCDECRK